jgi:hypothetical protein
MRGDKLPVRSWYDGQLILPIGYSHPALHAPLEKTGVKGVRQTGLQPVSFSKFLRL